jgi:crotonobetainyl-CoA:carnitine CoA-transferase CaiB-like acyl-CoA transferase
MACWPRCAIATGGAGGSIDIALLDVQIATMANQALSALVTGQDPPRLGNAHPSIAPYDVFPAADGHLILAVGNDGQFARLCEVFGAPDLATDRSFATNAARAANRAALTETLNALLMARTRADWLARLEAANVPAGPINGLSAAFDDPQARARGLRIDVPHASLGTTPGVASPLRLSATPPTYDRGPPVLGQDTGAVLGDLLGLDPGEIEALFVNGVVAGAR